MPESRVSVPLEPRDLFLSYNSHDRAWVAQTRDFLHSHGITTLYDKADFLPGRCWFDDIETAVERVRGVAVFVGRAGLGSIQRREMQFALHRQMKQEELGASFLVIPLLIDDADPDVVSSLLALNTWVRFKNPTDPTAVAVLRQALRGSVNQSQRAESTICPYRALQVFREEDAALFFGREVLADRLHAAVSRRKFVAVVGDSGSGKSSLVQAGLIPRLRFRSLSDGVFEPLIISPGKRPFYYLSKALVDLWSDPDRPRTDVLAESEELTDQLIKRRIPLAAAVEEALQRVAEARQSSVPFDLLLVIDQFEQLYTLASPEETDSFVKQILDAIEGSRLSIVLTLSADFYSHAIGRSRALSDAIQVGLINVGPMNREELWRAIERPALITGNRFEAGLVDRILSAVEKRPGSLPLLEFALSELWRARASGVFTHHAYGEIGEVKGAISKRAQRIFDNLKADKQSIALRVLGRLVRVSASEQVDSQEILALNELDPTAQQIVREFANREQVDSQEILALNELDPTAQQIVREFAKERLLVLSGTGRPDEETVEVAHEALFREWDTLRKYIDGNRGFFLWRQRLAFHVEEWQGSGHSASAVLRGPMLLDALRWHEKRRADFNDSEERFINASAKGRTRRWVIAVSLTALILLLAVGVFLLSRPSIRVTPTDKDVISAIVKFAPVKEAAASHPDDPDSRIETISEWFVELSRVKGPEEALAAVSSHGWDISDDPLAVCAPAALADSLTLVDPQTAKFLMKNATELSFMVQRRSKVEEALCLSKTEHARDWPKFGHLLNYLIDIDWEGIHGRQLTKTKSLSTLYEALIRSGDERPAAAVLKRALAAANEPGSEQADSYLEIIKRLVHVGKVQEAIDVRGMLRSAGFEGRDDHVTALIAGALAQQDKIEEAIKETNRLYVHTDDAMWADMLIIQSLARKGEIDRIKHAATATDGNGWEIRTPAHARLVATVAEELAKLGKKNDAQELRDRALSEAGQIENDDDRSKAFAAIAPVCARLGNFDQARLTADKCARSLDKLAAYTKILRVYADVRQGGGPKR